MKEKMEEEDEVKEHPDIHHVAPQHRQYLGKSWLEQLLEVSVKVS